MSNVARVWFAGVREGFLVGGILGDLVIVSLFFGLGIQQLCLEGGCCFGPRWLLERDF